MVKIGFTLPNLSPLHLHFQTHLPTMVIIAWGGGVGVFSFQFSHLVMSDSLQPHELQHACPVHHQLPESTQTHVHCVDDAIQPSHPVSSPSPPALNLSQHQGLFK